MRRVWTHSSAKERLGRTKSRHNPFIAGPLVKAGVGVLVLTAIAALPSQAGQPLQISPDQTLDQTQTRGATRLDAELANACIRDGRTKSECVCTVRTLRENVQALDYAPSARLQTASYSKSSEAVSAAKISLEKSGVSPSEIQALDRQRRNLVKTRIEPICSAAAGGEPSYL